MSAPTRTYRRAELSVEWRPELCIHCQNCINGLPSVFDLSKRPWVNIDGASAQEIHEQVEKCPTGALALGGVA